MKMTQKDKILLLVLAMIAVVAIAVIIPKFGIMACNEAMNEFDTKTITLNEETDATIAALKKMGVDAAFAEQTSLARKRLEERIAKAKEEAACLAGSIMAYAQSYDVDEQWIYGLEYKGGLKSSDDNLLLSMDKDNDIKKEPNSTNTFNITDNPNDAYTVQSAIRYIEFYVSEMADCNFEYDFLMEGFTTDEIAAIVLYLQQITSKGSLLITEVEIKNGEKSRVTLTALMTETDNISRYAQEVAESKAQQESEE